MTDWTVVAAAAAVLLVLLAIRTPVAFSLITAALVGYSLLIGPDTAGATLSSLPYSTIADYNLVLVPMFMVMGLAANAAGILESVFDLAARATRRLPGGLAIGATLSAGFLGGISGSSVADTATLGRVTTGHMNKRGYDLGFSAAVVAASNTVAILIPPSLGLVLIGIITAQPIGPLLLAGIVPGVLTIVAYAVCCLLMARVRPQDVFVDGVAPSKSHVDDVPKSDVVVMWSSLAGGIVLIGTVLGGLYSGVFTAVEAGFAGAAISILVAVVLIPLRRRRLGRDQASYRRLWPAITEAAELTGMVFLLLVGATMFSNFLVLAGVPSSVASTLSNDNLPPVVVAVGFLVVTLILGAVLDPIAITLIVAPIAFPVLTALGYDQVWYAILFIKAVEIGLLTPPVGINAFVVASVTPGLRVERVFVRLIPFIATELVVLTILFAFPQLITWLPGTAS